MEEFGVRWSGMKAEDCFLSMYNGEDVDGFVSWIDKIKPVVSWDVYFTVVYNSLTGLRSGEAVYSLNKIADVGLKAYPFNEQLRVLEHFRDRWFLRKSKKAYVSVLTPRLEKILDCEWKQKISYNLIRLRLKRRNLECKMSLARKFHNTLLWKNGVDEQTINLLAGRIGTGIFQRHYWRPNVGEIFMEVRRILEPWEARFLS
ncbi:MAG: integrase [Candidatus Bathyarchaeia archaeon]